MESTNNDLVFNVAQLMKEPVGATRKLEISTPALGLSDDREAPGVGSEMLQARYVEGRVKVTRLSRDLLVQGDVAAQVEGECSRCLTNITVAVEGKLEEEFQPTVDVETGRPVRREAVETGETEFEITANHELDLTEPVRQTLLVALPLKPLCRGDCKGLCPQCGANWNEGPCDCEIETVDERWSGLRQIQLEDLPAGHTNGN